MDVPLGEEREFYQVEVIRDTDTVGVFDAETPQITIPISTVHSGDEIHIRQGSQAYGYGVPLSLELSF
jgi:hypothetical protein